MDNRFRQAISDASRTLLSYARARTATPEDAEDLAQDILCELIRSLPQLREEAAFYGFMWGVAGNVVRRYYRRRAKNPECPLTEEMAEVLAAPEEAEDDAILCLRRELSLLSQQYRRAVVLYYVQGRSCAEIARETGESESMVKYHLFKARNTVKEGMTMTRSYGEQSYAPRNIELYYMGEGPNRYWEITHKNLIRQNILWACAHDALTEQAIALEIGVSLPYIEGDIERLTEAGLLMKTGRRYRTNILILTAEFGAERAARLAPTATAIARYGMEAVDAALPAVRRIGFWGTEMSENTLRWHLSGLLLESAYCRFADTAREGRAYPVTPFGEHALVWGVEAAASADIFARCTVFGQGERPFRIHFLDYRPAPAGDHHDFYGKSQRIQVMEHVLRGGCPDTPLEAEVTAELTALGYLRENRHPTVPVYTEAQFDAVFALLDGAITTVTERLTEMGEQSIRILREHAPTHLARQAGDIATADLFDAGVGAPTRHMLEAGWLSAAWTAGEMPTAYIVMD